jgi:hypothetical protein
MSVDNSSDGGAWVVGRKYIVTPDSYGTEADGCGGPLRVRLRSPRLARALLECGVLLEELKELDECTFFGRYSADEQVVAEREWEEAEKLRIERLETVFAARRRGILAKGKQAESSTSDEKASRLLDRSSMLQREQEFVKRHESSRQRRAEFELSQSKLFAEQRQHTVDAAAHKTERAAATRRELEQRRLEADAARVAARARTQQRCVRGEGGSRRGLFPLPSPLGSAAHHRLAHSYSGWRRSRSAASERAKRRAKIWSSGMLRWHGVHAHSSRCMHGLLLLLLLLLPLLLEFASAAAVHWTLLRYRFYGFCGGA